MKINNRRLTQVLSVILTLCVFLTAVSLAPLSAAAETTDLSPIFSSAKEISVVNDFLQSAYNGVNYTVYDGSNEENFFSMNGRKYYQGFTLSGKDYQNTEVTFDVKNTNSIEMTIGHLDNEWASDQTMKVYRDGEWWQDVPLTVHGKLMTKRFNVSDISTLRFFISSHCRYGFADIKVDENTSLAPDIPYYSNINSFLQSGYDRINYTVYDGTNENSFFSMNGRKYYQGFTLAGKDYQNTEVSFNVENVNSIEMTIGHLDDEWANDQTIKVYRDGEWWQDVPLTVHGKLMTKRFDVSDISTLRFYISSHCRYGFADIKVDENTSKAPDIPAYSNINAFLRSGYDRINYTVYDGTNENSFFSINGRKYYQGFTLSGKDYQNTEVSFNVENVNSIEMTIGHLDDEWANDQTMKVYRDGEWWQDVPLTVHGKLFTKKFDVSDISTLRFFISSHCRYGFADIKVDENTSLAPDIPYYSNINSFLQSGYDRINYTVYDGTNENSFFSINGRKYYQGFTLSGKDYQNTEVSFNVENVNSIEMTIGHLDDEWANDQTMKVYRDDEWWQDVPLTVHGKLLTKRFDVSDISTLRFYISSHCRYGFADIKVDENTSVAPDIPTYSNINDFIQSGYNRINYTVYDGSNENSFFSINGRNYYQGFTLMGKDYQNTEVSFNVENLNHVSFGVGHLDNEGGDDQDLVIFKDGKEYYRIPLKTDDEVKYYSIGVNSCKTLRFFINSHSRYGFVDFTFNENYASGLSANDYVNIDELVPDNPTETEPVTDNPAESTQPTQTNPVSYNPTEPTVTKPVSYNPTEPTVTKPVSYNPAEPTQSKETLPAEPALTQSAKTDISNWNVGGVKNMTFTGKVIKQNILVYKNGEYADFTTKYKNNVNVGTATVTITAIGDYTGTITKTFKITKANNPIKVKAKKAIIAKAKKKTIIKKAIKVKKAQGKVTYKTNNKKVTVKNGKITVAKGLKKGKTYKVKITISAMGNSNYNSKRIIKTIKIKVK